MPKKMLYVVIALFVTSCVYPSSPLFTSKLYASSATPHPTLTIATSTPTPRPTITPTPTPTPAPWRVLLVIEVCIDLAKDYICGFGDTPIEDAILIVHFYDLPPIETFTNLPPTKTGGIASLETTLPGYSQDPYAMLASNKRISSKYGDGCPNNTKSTTISASLGGNSLQYDQVFVESLAIPLCNQ